MTDWKELGREQARDLLRNKSIREMTETEIKEFCLKEEQRLSDNIAAQTGLGEHYSRARESFFDGCSKFIKNKQERENIQALFENAVLDDIGLLADHAGKRIWEQPVDPVDVEHEIWLEEIGGQTYFDSHLYAEDFVKKWMEEFDDEDKFEKHKNAAIVQCVRDVTNEEERERCLGAYKRLGWKEREYLKNLWWTRFNIEGKKITPEDREIARQLEKKRMKIKELL